MNRRDTAILGVAAGGLALWYLTRNRDQTFSFTGKTVFLTGGSRGLGLVLARQLVRAGARLAMCARDQDELERAAKDLSGHGAAPMTVVADVTEPAQVHAAIHQVEAGLGPIDVLINNAGIIAVGPVETMTRQDFEDALRVAFWGSYNTIEAVLPGMRARRQGRIVNISSIGGKIGVPHLTPYCVGKFALTGYSQALRAELAKDGITVTLVCPGLMRTGSPRNASFKGQQAAEYTWFKVSDSIPGLTVSAEQAAAEIIESTRRGDAELTISLPAKLGVFLNAACPELTATLTALANRLLPSDGGAGPASKPGKHCEISNALSALTFLTDRAAVQNNEVEPNEMDRDELRLVK